MRCQAIEQTSPCLRVGTSVVFISQDQPAHLVCLVLHSATLWLEENSANIVLVEQSAVWLLEIHTFTLVRRPILYIEMSTRQHFPGPLSDFWKRSATSVSMNIVRQDLAVTTGEDTEHFLVSTQAFLGLHSGCSLSLSCFAFSCTGSSSASNAQVPNRQFCLVEQVAGWSEGVENGVWFLAFVSMHIEWHLLTGMVTVCEHSLIYVLTLNGAWASIQIYCEQVFTWGHNFFGF